MMGSSPHGLAASFMLNSANFWTRPLHKEPETTASLYCDMSK